MMRHCRQCRADAIGLLGEDRSSEFMKMGSCRAGCGPSPEDREPSLVKIDRPARILAAVATTDGKNVDSGFGNASRFDIYSINMGETVFLRTVNIDTTKQVAGEAHKEHIENIADVLDDCSIIIVKEIGHMPSKLLAKRGKTVRISSGEIGKGTFDTE